MKSLTHKLAVIFLIMSVPPLVIGANAAWSMRTVFASMETNDAALKDLARQLHGAAAMLRDGNEMQANANRVAAQAAGEQRAAAASLRAAVEDVLPRSSAVVRIRFALLDAVVAQRAMLLAAVMPPTTEPAELERVRARPVAALERAFAALGAVEEDYRARVAAAPISPEEAGAWKACDEALREWRENHEVLLKDMAALNAAGQTEQAFDAAFRKAYGAVFTTGRAAREKCELRLEALELSLAASMDGNVRGAIRSQGFSAALLAGMGEEAAGASRRAAGMAAQFDTALAAANDATAFAAAALDDIVRRFWFLAVLSVAGIAGAVCLGVYFAVRTSKPVRSIARHMSRLAGGDVADDVSAEYRERKDEIGQLARAMQELVHSDRGEIAMANAMANGDYTKSIDLRSGEDQLGAALRTMLATSNSTLRHVGLAVERLSGGAQSVSEASRSLSQGAQTSAQALEEINQSVGHVDAQAKENARRASEADALATGSRDAAKRGYGAVTGLVDAMREIQQSGAKIAVVAKLIDDIAFQTNLLALNAAVEAARAGRQGKGFSVVADEVRSLSARSAKAARETGEMVESMTGRMRAGAELAVKSDNEFREIVDATDRVAHIFREISAASDAQSTAMAQIAEGLGQIDNVIQENTQSAGLTAASALQLSRQAEELNGIVSRFRLVAGTESAGAPRLTRERTKELLMISDSSGVAEE